MLKTLPHRLALDSVRSYDADGRLHIARTRISKATVNGYRGDEIPGAEQLGLYPNKIYNLLRSPEELAKGAASFARNQILGKHIIVSSDNIQSDHIVGAIGSNVEYAEPYLWADVCIWDEDAIKGIENDSVREFSCAYRYIPVMIKGTFQGQDYDGIMTEIAGNHLALVETGRAGPDVLAADNKLEIDTMRMTRFGKGLFIALKALAPKIAQDAALPALVGQLTRQTVDKVSLKTKLLAMDADLNSEEIDSVMDGMTDENDKEVKRSAEDEDDEDETDEEKKKREAKDKKAKDKAAKDAEAEEKGKKAMDAAIATVIGNLREADEARRAVRETVGEVAFDSALEVYGFALDHLKIPHAEVKELAGKKALFGLALQKNAPAAPVVAMDAGSLLTQFPNLKRFA